MKNLSADRLDGIDSSRLATKSDLTQFATRSDLGVLNRRVTDLGQRESGFTSIQPGFQSDILMYNEDSPGTAPLGLRLACDPLPDGRVRARIVGVGERFSVSGSAGVVIPPDGVSVADGAQPPTLVSVDGKPDSGNFYTYTYAAQIESVVGPTPERTHLEGTLIVDLRSAGDDQCIARATR